MSQSLIGSVFKNIAVFPSTFPLLFTGQVISQLAWSLTTSRAGQLANMWCKSNEISFGTVIGSTGFMLGSGLGYLVPLFIVKDTPSLANDDYNNEFGLLFNQTESSISRKEFQKYIIDIKNKETWGHFCSNPNPGLKFVLLVDSSKMTRKILLSVKKHNYKFYC